MYLSRNTSFKGSVCTACHIDRLNTPSYTQQQRWKCKTTTYRTGGRPSQIGYLLPVFLVTVITLPGLLGAVGCLAGVARSDAHDVVAHVAVGLRFLVVGLAGLGGFEEFSIGLRVDGGRGPGRSWSRRLGLAGSGSLILGVLIPTNLFLSGSSCSPVSIDSKWPKRMQACTNP